eukprot:354734-Chlamydomonas_euryale.AAC.3
MYTGRCTPHRGAPRSTVFPTHYGVGPEQWPCGDDVNRGTPAPDCAAFRPVASRDDGAVYVRYAWRPGRSPWPRLWGVATPSRTCWTP